MCLRRRFRRELIAPPRCREQMAFIKMNEDDEEMNRRKAIIEK
jgi:hypothetical protein